MSTAGAIFSYQGGHTQNEAVLKKTEASNQWTQATTRIQIAISLAAITVLTRRTWLYWALIVASIAGVARWGLAWAH